MVAQVPPPPLQAASAIRVVWSIHAGWVGCCCSLIGAAKSLWALQRVVVQHRTQAR